MITDALHLFCDVIRYQMDLADDQVYIYNQKINIPTDSRLYIAVGVLVVKPFGNSNVPISTAGLDELQSANFLANLSVDVFSKGTDALTRKEEVILALNSTYSKSLQQTYGFYIAKHSSSFVNLSAIEGSIIPYRFNLGVNIQYKITKQQPIDYYDNFDKTIITEG